MTSKQGEYLSGQEVKRTNPSQPKGMKRLATKYTAGHKRMIKQKRQKGLGIENRGIQSFNAGLPVEGTPPKPRLPRFCILNTSFAHVKLLTTGGLLNLGTLEVCNAGKLQP